MTNQIRAIRRLRDLTQQDVADALGTVKSAVSQWETGYMGMSVTNLCRLADLLGVTTDALLGREDIDEQDDSTTLKTVIEGSGYSYQRLQEFTGIPKSAIQRYASGTTKKIPADRLRKLYKLLGREDAPTPDHDNTQPTTKEVSKMGILKAYKAGLEAAQEHKNWSRFDCATFLHGYDSGLTFDELAEITQEIAVELGRSW